MRRHSTAIVLVSALLGLGSSVSGQFEPDAPAEAPTKVELPPQPEIPAEDANATPDVRAILVDLRNPAATPTVRRLAADKLIAMGDAGALRVVDYTAKELRVRGKTYESKLQSAAEQVLVARFKSAGKADKDLEAMRKSATDISRGQGLTKERIHDGVDPVLKKCESLLSLDAAALIKEKPDLAAQRNELLDLADWHDIALGKLSADARKKNEALTASAKATIPTRKQLSDQLVLEESQAAAMAMPMSPADRKVLAANASIAKSLPAGEVAGIAELNRIRVLLGMNALEIDPKLCDASRGHSLDMKERNFFSHESPVPGKETPWKRAQLAGTSASAENIFTGSSDPKGAINAWWYSPGHHANMMGAHRRVGLGNQGGYWTMMLGD